MKAATGGNGLWHCSHSAPRGTLVLLAKPCRADRARLREREQCKPLAGGRELLRQRRADALEQLADLGVWAQL